MLDTQYRMHPSLCSFPSAEFYKGRLQSGVTPEQRPQLRGFRWPKPDCSVALVPSRSPEDQGGGGASSKRNTGEAQQLVSVPRTILLPPTPTPTLTPTLTLTRTPTPTLPPTLALTLNPGAARHLTRG